MEQSKIGLVKRTSLFFSQERLDEPALEEAFHAYYARVYAVVFRLVGDPDEADELTAETFYRLWAKPPRSNENLAGWLYRVATRLGYNAMRASRRRQLYEAEAGKQIEDSGAGCTPEPETTIERRLERQKVREILRQMNMREVQILVLRHSGLSYKEIASTIHTLPTSIGSLLARAEARFECLYRKGDPDAPEK